MPILAFFMLVFTLSSVGLPGLNGFTGEFLLLLGMFERGFAGPPVDWAFQFQTIAVLAVVGVVLGAWYMLWLVQRTFFGPLREPVDEGHAPVRDLAFREVAALAPLVVFIVWIGVQPRVFLDPMSPTLDHVADVVEDAYERRYDVERSNRSQAVLADRAGAETSTVATAGDASGVARP
jgi:NADH-quinone oxidoreductase subunit M